MQINTLPVIQHQMQQHTEEDQTLSKVLKYTQNDWPNQLDPHSVTDNKSSQFLLWGVRVIVPEKLRAAVLEELHTSYPGEVTGSIIFLVAGYGQANRRNGLLL